MHTIKIRKTSITDLDTDIIVNAANEWLAMGGGVCGYIFRAAGAERLQAACDQIGGCKTGSAVITPGFDLCRYIVHAVGPVWHGGTQSESEKLYGCYQASLDLAKEYGCHSIGFPLISAGIFGYPKEEAWQVALSSVMDWFHANEDYDIEVQFAILDDAILKLGTETAEKAGIVLQ